MKKQVLFVAIVVLVVALLTTAWGAEQPGGDSYQPFKLLGPTGNVPMLKGESDLTHHRLGKLTLSGREVVAFELAGALNAIPGQQYFDMIPAKKGDYSIVYLVSKGSASKPSKPKPIARIGVQHGSLFLQWARGIAPKEGNCLLNCGLVIFVNQSSHFLPLGRPRIVEPVYINYEAGAGDGDYPAESLPERESLRLEIVRLMDWFPKGQFEPGNTLIPGGTGKIRFDATYLPKFWLRLGFDVKSETATVNVTAHIDYEWQNLPAAQFSPKDLARVARSVLVEQEKIFAELEKMPPDYNKRRYELKNKLGPIQEKLGRFKGLEVPIQKGPGKIHFRIYTVIDENHRVVVMQSFDPKDASKYIKYNGANQDLDSDR